MSTRIMTALRRLRTLLVMAVLTGLVMGCMGMKPPQADDGMALVPDLLKGRLDNGLTYLIRPNRAPQDRAYVYLAVASGSIHEDDDQRGLAHLLEHMAFNGTEHWPENDLIAYLQGLGMRFGPEINAYTSFDRTVYTLEVPLDQPEALATALSVLDDWARRISLDPVEITKEIPVVYEEYRLSRGAEDRISKAQLPLLLGDSLYGKRLPIGLPEVFQAADREKLERYYRDWYRPERMAVIVVGEVDPPTVARQIEEIFSGAFPNNPPRPEPKVDPVLPRKGNFDFLALSDPELSYGYVQVLLRQPPPGPENSLKEYQRRSLESLVLGAANQRLAARQTDPTAPWAFAEISRADVTAGNSFVALTLVPKPGRTADALAELMAFRRELVAQGLGAPEIRGMTDQYLGFLRQITNEGDRTESGMLADELVRHFVEDEPVPGVAEELRILSQYFNNLPDGTIHQVIRDLLGGSDTTVLSAMPASRAADLPLREATATLVSETDRAVASALRLPLQGIAQDAEDAAPRSLMAQPPEPGRIVSAQGLAKNTLVRLDLENGMTVYLHPSKLKNDEIVMFAMAPGGLSAASDQEFDSARLALSLAAYSGLGDLDAQALRQFLLGKSASVEPYMDQFQHGFSASSSSDGLALMMELAHLQFTGLRIDDQASLAFIEAARTSLADQQASPEALFSRTVSRVTTGNHPRFQPLQASDLDKVDPAVARDFLHRSFVPQGFVVAIGGTFDIKQARNLVETWLASIPGAGDQGTDGTPAKAQANAGVPSRPGLSTPLVRPQGVTETVYQGQDDKALSWLGWYAPRAYRYPDFVAGRVLKELLDIRLIRQIRERMSGVYSIGATVAWQSDPQDELVLGISYGSDPSRADELAAAVRTELASIQAGQISPDDFQRAVSIVATAWESDLRRNSTWVNLPVQLTVQRRVSDPLAFTDFADILATLTVEDLSALARSWTLDQGNRITLQPGLNP